LVTKNAWQTPLGARLNRGNIAFIAKNSLLLVSWVNRMSLSANLSLDK